MDGMEILKQIKHESPETECIIITAIDDIESAVQAIRFGAYDYLVKPINSNRVAISINHALERYQLKQGIALFNRLQSYRDLKNPGAFSSMIAKDESMALVFHQAEVCAESDYNVMITGETGVGKGMLARIIHKLSRRNSGPFMAVNMPAFNKNLFEDELFGHIKGAYTGAIAEKKGFFEAAKGGTLFLDEITELDPNTQGKLLRVIEEKEFYRLGSTEIVNVDLRIMSASNCNINEAIVKGVFRSDLYYRLNEYQINIPPLRKRVKDIPALAEFFLRRHSLKNNKHVSQLSHDLLEALVEYPFPGNVRELENIIASAVLVEKKDVLSLSAAMNLKDKENLSRQNNQKLYTLSELERLHIKKTLDITEGNKTKAARMLGIGLRTLQRKIKTYSENMS
jgi:DNA-binding NtrC family response regulator